MPRHEGPVAAEHHAVDADFVDQEAERLLTADDGVVVEAALVRARRLGDAASLGRHALPAAIQAPHRVAGGPTAVGDADLERRTGLEDAEDQDRDDDRVVEDDAEAVEEPVLGRALHQEVVLRLRMEEQHGAQRLGRLEQRPELRLVPVLAVDHRVELGALQAEHGHGALQLVDRRLDVLDGQGGEAREALRPLPDHPGDLVVHLARQREPLRRVEVIAKERCVDRNDLDVHPLRVHVLQPLFRGEAHLGRREADAPSASQHGADPVARLMTKAVPFAAGFRRLPEGSRHEVGVDVDGLHARSPPTTS